jgi:hypothetical protein
MQLLDAISNEILLNVPNLNEEINLFKNYYPENPNEIVSVIDSGGFPPNKYSPIREKNFEIKIRSLNYHDGLEVGNQIMKLFHSKNNYVLGDFFIYQSYLNSELTYLYSDKQNRDEFSLEIAFQFKN